MYGAFFKSRKGKQCWVQIFLLEFDKYQHGANGFLIKIEKGLEDSKKIAYIDKSTFSLSMIVELLN